MYECTIVLVGILHNCRVRVAWKLGSLEAWKLGSNATEEIPHSQTAQNHMDHGHHGCAKHLRKKVKNGDNTLLTSEASRKNVVPVS